MPSINGNQHRPGSVRDAPKPQPEASVHAEASRDPLAFEPFVEHFADLHRSFRVYLQTWVDESRFRVERLVLWAICAVAAGSMGLVALITAVVLVLQGLVGAVAASTGSTWSGQLIVGSGIVCLASVALWIAALLHSRSIRLRIARKYEGTAHAECRADT